MCRMSSAQEAHSYLSARSPNPSNNGSNETYIDPSPIAPSSNGTEFTDLDEAVEHQKETPSEAKRMIRSHPPTLRQPELTVGEENDGGARGHMLIYLGPDQNVGTCKTCTVSV